MTVEHLDSEVRIPYDEAALLSNNPQQLADYIKELVITLQDLIEKITTIANYSIDLFDGNALYSKLKNTDGTYPLNTWRLIQVGNDWERQVQLTLGTWTFAGAFENPI